MTPLVSIIMPAYNTARYVAAAIESVMWQTYKNWELLVIDDGSTDGSSDIIKKFTDPRIQYFYQSNRGVSAARNAGIMRMKGDFFCFLDSDDVLPAESVSKRVEVFLTRPEVSIVDGYVEVFDERMAGRMKTWRPSPHGRVIASLFGLRSDCFFALTWMMRVVPGTAYVFDEQMTHAEDLLFLTGVSLTGEYDYVHLPIYQYRLTRASAMTKTDGLGKGYWQYYHKVCKLYPAEMTERMKWVLSIKIRKIMFLSYLADRNVVKALQYLVMGRTH